MRSVPPRGSGWVRPGDNHAAVLFAQRKPPATAWWYSPHFIADHDRTASRQSASHTLVGEPYPPTVAESIHVRCAILASLIRQQLSLFWTVIPRTLRVLLLR